MSDNGATQTERKKARGKRRSFAGELADLQARVGMAVRLLRKCTPTDPTPIAGQVDGKLIEVAIQTLEGK